MSNNVGLTRILLRKIKTNQIGSYLHSFEDINANRDDYTEIIQISDCNNRIDKYKTKKNQYPLRGITSVKLTN